MGRGDGQATIKTSRPETSRCTYKLNPGNLEPISVTIAEATRLLGFKDSKTVYNLIYQGKIKARKVGRVYLVSYASLKKLIEG